MPGAARGAARHATGSRDLVARPATRLPHTGRNATFVIERGRALLVRIGEDTHVVEAGHLHEVEELLEIGIGLAGEADDEGGADGHAGNAAADALDHAEEVAASG